ncbi:MAG TPA: restriction endonuclease subunit S [Candidatus Aquicultor sp.]|jgi:type I restriction enzyme S subunit
MDNITSGKYPVVLGKDCLLDVKHGSSNSPASKPTGLGVLKISAVTQGEFVPSEKKYAIDDQRLLKEFDLRAGDILMCRTNGTLAYVGMSALVEQDMANLIFPDKIIRIRTKENILPSYLWKLLQLPPMRQQIEAAARTAVGNYAIGNKDIWNLRIPLPPLRVQHFIIKTLEEQLSKIKRQMKARTEVVHDIERDIEILILGTKDKD